VRLSFKKAKYDIAWCYGAAISEKLCVCIHTKKNPPKKPMQFFYISEEAENISCEFYILDKRYKGFLKNRNPELDDRRPGGRRIMVIIWSKKIDLTSWFSLQ
jgi:hypothetical protein